MHRRTVLVATEDTHTQAWLESSVASLDVILTVVSIAGIESALLTSGADVLIADATRGRDTTIAAVEAAVAAGAETSLLLVVDADDLGSLRLPRRITSDFVLRSAAPAELAARVRVLAWPGEDVSADEIIRSDDLMLNLATYQAYVKGEPVEFTYLEYALFSFLVTHPNRVYSREALLGRVWGTDYFGGARTVDVHVRRVRSKLGPELARRLETVRNVGYLWQN